MYVQLLLNILVVREKRSKLTTIVLYLSNIIFRFKKNMTALQPEKNPGQSGLGGIDFLEKIQASFLLNI